MAFNTMEIGMFLENEINEKNLAYTNGHRRSLHLDELDGNYDELLEKALESMS